MLTLDASSLQKIIPAHGLSEQEIHSAAGKISEFLKRIDKREQGFYRDEVLDNESLIKEIEAYAKDKQGKYAHIVVLGIGGSALGAICLKEAFGNLFSGTNPELIILDNIDPTLLSECREYIDLKKTLFIVITKSGGTPETLAQYFFFAAEVEKNGEKLNEHFVFITDPKKGFLREEALKENIVSFPVPPSVGGRFSVLTAVGLVPAALVGINIRELLAGAQEMKELFFSPELGKNLPFQIATIQYLLSKKGKTITVMMPYAQKLFRFADWYRQLLAESIGKALDENGAQVHTGLTPVNALGVTDQHSQSQLYMEGPFDKLLIFLDVEHFGKDLSIPLPDKSDSHVNFLQDVSFAKLLYTEKHATAEALTQNNRPHITIRIDEISEKNIGALFLLFEAAIAFLGEFYEINAFDQPGVELSKILTKKLLT